MSTPLIEDLARAHCGAVNVARILGLLPNDKRLPILCHFQANGEADASSLAQLAGLSTSAMSQHLARLREDGATDCRRGGQALLYRISDTRIAQDFGAVRKIFRLHLHPDASRRHAV